MPLGLTTYYFKSMEDLYTAAYLLFVEETEGYVQQIQEMGMQSLSDYVDAERKTPETLARLIETLSDKITDYIVSLVTHEEQYRMIEAAFNHAALTNPQLNRCVFDREKQFIALARDWFESFGTASPAHDAHTFVGLMNHLERWCLLDKEQAIDRAFLNQAVSQFFHNILTA